MTVVRVAPSWLALRESADAAARDIGLVEQLRRCLPAERPLRVHDLACGTGSMLRWLAPQLPGPQHWICHDLDRDLLAIAALDADRLAADGSAVVIETREHDVTRITHRELAGAALVTTSALLDLLTADELQHIVRTCADAECPALFTLSVTGGVELWPPHRLDAVVGAAFNVHQQRTTGGRRLLGPAAARHVADAFRQAGYDVVLRPSPWRLGAQDQTLTAAWFAGWLGAACEQDPALVAQTRDFAQLRLADIQAGRLRVLVHHSDVLALPARPTRGAG
jgi:hypothetical protein